MAHFSYNDSPYPIRDDIKLEYRQFWQRLAGAGSWWSGAERVAIAAESRLASHCKFCAERRQALSPYKLQGQHDSAGDLDDLAVDAVHRIVTDQARISQTWVDQMADKGFSNEAYVELAGIVVTVFSVDEFNRALGLELEPLPQPVTGEPSRYRPSQAVGGTGFVPMISAEGATGAESDLYRGSRGANVLRALSLVPDAVRDWRRLASVQYISVEGMTNLVKQDDRVINRMQMELVAGRVSAINECFY